MHRFFFLRILNFVYIFKIVYACVRIRNGGFCESRRHICRSYNLHHHKQRCAYTISPPHITPIIIYPFIFATNAYVIRNGRHCVSCRHISSSYNLHPHQQRCAYTISLPKKPYTNILYADKFSNYMYQQTHRSGTALCVLPPIFVYIKYILLPTTL